MLAALCLIRICGRAFDTARVAVSACLQKRFKAIPNTATTKRAAIVVLMCLRVLRNVIEDLMGSMAREYKYLE